jgi:hypothetical protein
MGNAAASVPYKQFDNPFMPSLRRRGIKSLTPADLSVDSYDTVFCN